MAEAEDDGVMRYSVHSIRAILDGAAKAGGWNPEYLERMRAQLAKCNFASPAQHAAAEAHFYAGRHPPPRHHHHLPRHAAGRGGRGAMVAQRHRPRLGGCSTDGRDVARLVGLLNKISPRNVDGLVPQILTCVKTHADATAAVRTVIEHALRQPMYLSIFIRLLGDISTIDHLRDPKDETPCSGMRIVGASVEALVQHVCFSGALVESCATSEDETYDDYCARVKTQSRLLAGVALAGHCMRACLCDDTHPAAFAAALLAHLLPSSAHQIVEYVLDAMSAFLATGALTSADRGKVVDVLVRTCDALDDLSARARFKLLDIADSS